MYNTKDKNRIHCKKKEKRNQQQQQYEDNFFSEQYYSPFSLIWPLVRDQPLFLP